MNVGINIALIVVLALAAIAGSAIHQADLNPSSAGIRGQNLNHNESMVRDSTPNLRQDDLGRSLDHEQSFVSQLFVSFFRAGLVCPPLMCNHNETLVRDLTASQPAADSSFRLSGRQSFAASIPIQLSMNWAGSGCSPWVCGANHNETLVSDTAMSQRNGNSNPWLGGERWFACWAFISFSSYRAGPGCSKWVCGSNHNETLVSDMTL